MSLPADLPITLSSLDTLMQRLCIFAWRDCSMQQGGPLRRAPVLYASETGNAEEAARMISERLQQLGLEAPLMEMNAMSMERLRDENFVVLVSSVYGHGDVPRNGEVCMW